MKFYQALVRSKPLRDDAGGIHYKVEDAVQDFIDAGYDTNKLVTGGKHHHDILYDEDQDLCIAVIYV